MKTTGLNFPYGQYWTSDFALSTSDNSVAKFATDQGSLIVGNLYINKYPDESDSDSCVRVHNSPYPSEHTVEIKSSVKKFNSQVARKFNFTGNFIDILTSVSLKNGTVIESLCIDQLHLSSKWQLIRVLVWNENSNVPSWFENSSSFESNTPFLAAVFESENRLIEIGTGDDLWRWILSRSLKNASSFFSLKYENNKWIINRKILCYHQAETLAKRDLLLSWYIYFGDSSQQTPDSDSFPEKCTRFDIASFAWKNEAKIAWNGKISEEPCYHADATRAILKKIVRTASATENPSPIALNGVKLSLCDLGSHLGRANNRILPHWNIIEINKFKKWANRQLFAKNSSLRMIPQKESNESKLPSIIL